MNKNSYCNSGECANGPGNRGPSTITITGAYLGGPNANRDDPTRLWPGA
jgi:hypothetical protein